MPDSTNPFFTGVAFGRSHLKTHFVAHGATKALCGKDINDLPGGISTIPAHHITRELFEIRWALPSRYCGVCNERAASLAGLL
jgi:hypothetical protein